MRRFILFIVVTVVLLVLSFKIVDGILILFDDMDAHMWQGFLGRWKSYEKGFYEIEFGPDGTFHEYEYGLMKRSGEFSVQGNTILLKYEEGSCPPDLEDGCSVSMEFAFDYDRLVLITREGRMSFRRSDSL